MVFIRAKSLISAYQRSNPVSIHIVLKQYFPSENTIKRAYLRQKGSNILTDYISVDINELYILLGKNIMAGILTLISKL